MRTQKTELMGHDNDEIRGKWRPRRATVAGTGPASADGPEPRLDDLQPDPKNKPSKEKLSERDRWMLDEKPPHY